MQPDLQLACTTTSSYFCEHCTKYMELYPSLISYNNSNMQEIYTICLYFISVSNFKVNLGIDYGILVGGSVSYKVLMGCKMLH